MSDFEIGWIISAVMGSVLTLLVMYLIRLRREAKGACDRDERIERLLKEHHDELHRVNECCLLILDGLVRRVPVTSETGQPDELLESEKLLEEMNELIKKWFDEFKKEQAEDGE